MAVTIFAAIDVGSYEVAWISIRFLQKSELKR